MATCRVSFLCSVLISMAFMCSCKHVRCCACVQRRRPFAINVWICFNVLACFQLYHFVSVHVHACGICTICDAHMLHEPSNTIGQRVYVQCLQPPLAPQVFQYPSRIWNRGWVWSGWDWDSWSWPNWWGPAEEESADWGGEAAGA